mgnify:FL=1
MSEQKAIVSVIVNNYNYASYVQKAIESACAQTYENTEVVVVDDGSTDNSRKIISTFGDRIIPVLQENGGQAAAFNSGLEASQGEIIIFLDADDYLFPTAVERVVSEWKPGISKIHYLLKGIDGNGQPLGYTYPSRGEYLGRGDIVEAMLKEGGYGVAPTSGNALSREVLTSIFPIPVGEYKISADGYLAVATPFYGEILAIEEPLGAYRVHGNNNWGTSMEGKQFRSFIEHDLIKQSLLSDKAAEFGHDVPTDILFRKNGHLWARIASLRLDPEHHPIETDSTLKLMYHGIRSAWLYSSELNWKKKNIITLWFLSVGLLPRPLSKQAIGWLFEQNSRPDFVKKFLALMRPLLNRA